MGKWLNSTNTMAILLAGAGVFYQLATPSCARAVEGGQGASRRAAAGVGAVRRGGGPPARHQLGIGLHARGPGSRGEARRLPEGPAGHEQPATRRGTLRQDLQPSGRFSRMHLARRARGDLERVAPGGGRPVPGTSRGEKPASFGKEEHGPRRLKLFIVSSSSVVLGQIVRRPGQKAHWRRLSEERVGCSI
jgi:hypothetical protein